MQVLRGTITKKTAKRMWDDVERQAATKKRDGEWPATMLLPCWHCTAKNNGVEVRKRLETFTSGTSRADMWNAIARGQGLECIRCYQGRVRKITSGVIYCEACEAYKPDTAFSEEAKKMLKNGDAGLVQCEGCEHGRTGMKRAAIIFEHCVSCNEDWPEGAFQGAALQAWRANKQPHLIT